MKKTTRVLSVLLALVMLVGILPVVVPTVANAADKTTPATYYNHLPSTAKDVVYVSDMDYISDNYVLKTSSGDYNSVYDSETGHFESIKDGRWSDGYKTNLVGNSIVLGGYYTLNTSTGTFSKTVGTTFAKGLGVMPKSKKTDTTTPSYTVVDLADNGYAQSYFYSAAGITNDTGKQYKVTSTTTSETVTDETTGEETTVEKTTYSLSTTKQSEGVIFEVWGSYDKSEENWENAEYVLLESSGTVYLNNVYQFHLDITGVRYLKLVVYYAASASYNNCAWGGTCLYNNPGYFPKTNLMSSDNNLNTTTWVPSGTDRFNTYNFDKLPADAVYLSGTDYKGASDYKGISGKVMEFKSASGNLGYTANGYWLGGVADTITNSSPQKYDGILFKDQTRYFRFNTQAPSKTNYESDGWVTFNISDKDVDTFYAVVGLGNDAGKHTAYNPTNGAYGGVIIRVYGSEDNVTYDLLAESEPALLSQTGEFMVDIAGYNYLKLYVKLKDNRNQASADVLIGYPCVFNRESAAAEFKTRIALNESLPMEFNVQQRDLFVKSNPYAKITYAGKEETVKFTDLETKYIEGVAYYGFTFDSIAAKEMTNKIGVTFCDDYGAITTLYEKSIQDYCLSQLEKNAASQTYDELYEKLLVDLLKYGAAAQEIFGYNTEALADKVLDGTDYAGTETVLYSAKYNPVKGEYYYGTRVGLKETIYMDFAFTNLTAGMTAEISYTNHHGVAKSATIAFDQMKQSTVEGETIYTVVLDDLLIADCREAVTVTIMNGETEVCSVTDSVSSYLARLKTNKTEYTEVCDALMTLSDSALSYFNGVENSPYQTYKGDGYATVPEGAIYLDGEQLTHTASMCLDDAPARYNVQWTGGSFKEIWLGGASGGNVNDDGGVQFTKGVAMQPYQPSEAHPYGECYATYDLSALDVDTFYAVVGLTNKNGQNYDETAAGAYGGIYYEVYATYEGGTEQLIAKSELITKTTTGEFTVDIDGVQTLKLVVKCKNNVSGAHASMSGMWANACVYNSTATNE